MNPKSKHNVPDREARGDPTPRRDSQVRAPGAARPGFARTSHRGRAVPLVLATLIAVAGAASCGKKGSPTAPYGGGGGTGTSFNLGPFAVGQSAKLSFANAGTFGYHCNPHRSMGMVGTVQVDASGSDSAVVRIAVSGLSFSPSSAHIKTGGSVRWVNASSATNHTVTSD